MKVVPFTTLLISLFLLSSCTKAPSDGKDETSGDSGGAVASTLKCGVFANGAFNTGIPLESLEPVRVNAIGADVVIIKRTTGEQAGNEQLVKLQGITASGLSDGKVKRARQMISDKAGFNAFFLPAADGCNVTFDGGGQGTVGQIITSEQESISEILVANGLAFPEAGSCGGDALAGCYAGIEVTEELSDQVISHLLWKPVSDSDGKLVILHDAFAVQVSVEGAASSMTGNNIGPGNGYATTLRYPLSGCAYGSPTLRFTDRLDRPVALANGETSLRIASGCERTDLRF